MAGPVSARDIFDLVLAIKRRIDKVSDNRLELNELAGDLHEDIKRLLNCIHSQRKAAKESKHLHDAQFDYALSALKDDLMRILSQCDMMINKDTSFRSRRGIKDFIHGVAHGDDVLKEIKALRRKVKSHYRQFSASGMVNLACNVSDIRRQLQGLLFAFDKKLSDSVTEAAANIRKATRLTGADQMDEVTMTMTLKRTARELQSDDNTAVEKAYLQTKVDTLHHLLRESFGSVQGPYLVPNRYSIVQISVNHSTSETGSSGNHHGDAVMRCLRFLRTLQDDSGYSLPSRHSSPSSLHQFATDLEAFSNSVYEIGFMSDAARVFKHAVSIRRTLTEDDFHRYGEQLAATLNNYAALVVHVDRTCKEALDCVEEAVEIYEDLFHNDPDKYDLHFAAIAHNLASISFQAGRPMAALHHSHCATEIIRPRVEERFDAFATDLATYLTTSALALCKVNRHAEGRPLIQEAVGIYQKLSGNRFSRHYPALAEALSILSDICWRLHDVDVAQLAIDTAVRIGRDLTSVADSPRIHQRCLSRYLHSLFLRLEYVEKERALCVIRELVQLRRKLARDDNRFRPDLGTALYNNAALLFRLKRFEEVGRVIGEALFVKRSLAEDTSVPDKLKSSLTACLEMQAEIKKRLQSPSIRHAEHKT